MSHAKLPLNFPPMEAQLVKALPDGDDWQFEPKWDGFRCIAHRDNDDIELISKSGQPLGRYFPEILVLLKRLSARRFVLDGELVVPEGKGLSFDKLLQRIHPAQSRIIKLANETPAVYILFDILVTADGDNVVEENILQRRERLEDFEREFVKGNKQITLTPVTDNRAVAEDWLNNKRSSIDGVIAKRTDVSYQSGNRKGMLKVKRKRTADCVIGGFRYGSNSKLVGSLLLGLYDDDGELHHVGFTSGFAKLDKKKLTAQLEELLTGESFTQNVPGAPSRWSTERSTQWEPVKPELVLEIEYDHFTNNRFRHGTKFLRWRPDKKPSQCTFEQLGLHETNHSADLQ